MNIAFAGFRHGHVFSVLKTVRTLSDVSVIAAWETHGDSVDAAREHGVVITHTDYDEMLCLPELDAVVIGDYYAARGEKIIKALLAGKHVYADKPLCTKLSELDEIERLSYEKKLSVGCMLDLRCSGAAGAAKAVVESGRMGEVHNISFGGQHALHYSTRAGWYFEKGKHGGTINDIAIHGIDLVRCITGKGIKTIDAARCWNAYAKEVPEFSDSAQFMLTLDGGAGLIADVSYAMPYPLSFGTPLGWRFTVWGENGVMEFQGGDDGVTLYLKNAAAPEFVAGTPLTADPFYDFLAETAGKPTAFTTAQVLRSARDTLKIQEKADYL